MTEIENYVLTYIQYWYPLDKSFSVAIKAHSFPQTKFALKTLITGENIFRFCEVIFSSVFKFKNYERSVLQT